MNHESSPSANDPLHDEARLTEIAELGLLSGEPDPLLQAAVDEAAKAMNLPTALISLVLDDVQFFAATHGTSGWIHEANGTPAEWSFCQHVVKNRAEFVVEDATKHAAVKDSPLVNYDGIRCYAGAPLMTSKGNVLGSFCVLGDKERQFTAEEIKLLRSFADRLVGAIERRRQEPPAQELAA